MKLLVLAFALATLWPAPLAGLSIAGAEPRDPSAELRDSSTEPHNAAAETADALFAAPETQAAIDKAADPAIKDRRARIQALAVQAPSDPAARAALTVAEEELIAALGERDADYAGKIAARRFELSGNATANVFGQAPMPDVQGGSSLAAEEREQQAQYEARAAAEAAPRYGGAQAPRAGAQTASRPERKAENAAAAPHRDATAGFSLGRRASQHPSQVLPSFPWPPPAPSERLNLTRAQILPASARRDPSLAYVADRIIGALQAAGYSEYSVYAAPHGFAIVARLERVKPDGTPAPDTLRFLAPNASEPFSLAAYVSRLFFAPEGYYRQIVFLVTSEMIRPSGPTPDAAAAEALLQGGADRLPAEYRRIRFTADDQVAALVYEYHKGPNVREVKTLTPGRLDARTNLMRAGLYARLVGGN
jgi:hypothetical protein